MYNLNLDIRLYLNTNLDLEFSYRNNSAARSPIFMEKLS